MEKPELIKTVYCGPEKSRQNLHIIMDEACKRLWNMRVSYSIEKITELEQELDAIADELESFIREHESGKKVFR